MRQVAAAVADMVKQVEQAVQYRPGDRVTFLVKSHRAGREGWKIMPEDERLSLAGNSAVLQQAGAGAAPHLPGVIQVVTTLRNMMYAGLHIPDRLTLVIQ